LIFIFVKLHSIEFFENGVKIINGTVIRWNCLVMCQIF